MPQSSALGPLLFTWYTSELSHIVGNPNVGYANDTAIYAVIPRLLLGSQIMNSLNQDLVVTNSWCFLFITTTESVGLIKH